MVTLGSRLKALRQEKGLTQKEVAKLIGTTDVSIGRYEMDARVPKADILNSLAKLYDVEIDYLLTGKEETEQPLNDRDKKDIEKDLKKIMDDFRDGESGPVYFDGIELDEDDMDKLEIAMRTALEIAKVKNKEKYTPKKYKK
ncbi:helix-turn-helix domain-containing protein [Peptacetobacter hiranonis]|uniref:DNA-binding helix-turn-helix protein n=1 Tax=Peptacetobacter hiranonis (strain DSM 13275 / JCM 10541 / KCTC 15199 / TO-931) TaxID=500633 RepID=B6FZV7_PEPHT|nr:helix-turn-helix domain-containing protein [Peptacetobacter hiranonis]EEA84930.1 DNA-binding helix-turn-helix protein [Peptacetobacter hiranonis DSM 13275]QEK20809.1 HTH-type transcriptional regulator ImmR [Peptacetobacter hiranonis]